MKKSVMLSEVTVVVFVVLALVTLSCFEDSDHFRLVRAWKELARMSLALEAHRAAFGEYPTDPWSTIAARFTSEGTLPIELPMRDAWGDAFHYKIHRGSDGLVTGYHLFSCTGDQDCNLGGVDFSAMADAPLVIESSVWRVREPPRHWAKEEISIGISELICRWTDSSRDGVSCSMVVKADERVGESEGDVRCLLNVRVRVAEETPPGLLQTSSEWVEVKLGKMSEEDISFSCDAACRDADELLIVVTLEVDRFRVFDRDLRDNVQVAHLRFAL